MNQKTSKIMLYSLLLLLLSFSVSALSIVDDGNFNSYNHFMFVEEGDTSVTKWGVFNLSDPGTTTQPNFTLRVPDAYHSYYGNTVVFNEEQSYPGDYGLVNISFTVDDTDLPLGRYLIYETVIDEPDVISSFGSWSNLWIYNYSDVYFEVNSSKSVGLPLIDMEAKIATFYVDGVPGVIYSDMMMGSSSYIYSLGSWVSDNSLMNGLSLDDVNLISYFEIESEDYLFDSFNNELFKRNGSNWDSTLEYAAGLPSTPGQSSFIIIDEKLILLHYYDAVASSYYLDESTSSWIQDDSYVAGSKLELKHDMNSFVSFVDNGVPRLLFVANVGPSLVIYLRWDSSIEEWVEDFNKIPFELSYHEMAESIVFGQLALGDGLNSIFLLNGMAYPGIAVPILDGGVSSSMDYSFPVVTPAPSPSGSSVNTNAGMSRSVSLPEDNSKKKFFFLVLVAVVSWFFITNDGFSSKKRRSRK